ncbi:ERF family protein [bacterium]|nr:ERF family protein [bacterium]
MTREETLARLAEQEETIDELRTTLNERPEKMIEVINEVTIENSSMGGEIGSLANALSQAQAEFTSVKKGSSGHGYNYADIEAVLKASTPIYTKYGLSIAQVNISKMLGKSVLTGVKTVLMHEMGGYISGDVYMPTQKTKMNSLVQMAGVNITYLRRYGIQSILGLATTDNDGSDK